MLYIAYQPHGQPLINKGDEVILQFKCSQETDTCKSLAAGLYCKLPDVKIIRDSRSINVAKEHEIRGDSSLHKR